METQNVGFVLLRFADYCLNKSLAKVIFEKKLNIDHRFGLNERCVRVIMLIASILVAIYFLNG